MNRRPLVSLYALAVLFIGVSTAQAGDVCAIHSAIRDGDAVRVVFSKSLPTAAITHPNGSKVFINNAAYKPPGTYTVPNPRTFVILHKGDKLGIIGMDSGCTITVVSVQNTLELRMDGGSFVQFLPVEDGKNAADFSAHP